MDCYTGPKTQNQKHKTKNTKPKNKHKEQTQFHFTCSHFLEKRFTKIKNTLLIGGTHDAFDRTTSVGSIYTCGESCSCGGPEWPAFVRVPLHETR